MRFAFMGVALALVACGPDPREGCESSGCHGVVGRDNAIEDAHPRLELLCTSCHGGDPAADTMEAAHVPAGPEFVAAAPRNGYIGNLSVNELDEVHPDYLRFINPGDYRVAARSCGSASPEAASGCHQELVDSAPRSVMSTFVGHFSGPRFMAGMQGRAAELGSVAIDDPDYAGERGAVASLLQAQPPPDDAPLDEVSTLMDHYLVKNCTHCHAWSFGRNDARGNLRSSGCTSCHMIYNNDGESFSSDPSRADDLLPHPERHELTVAITSEQCEHCHYQGARIGLLYRGVIEWGVAAEPPYPDIGESLHNHPPEFYLEAPEGSRHQGDLHFYAGLECADCHNGRDVHGDGRIYSTAKFQVSVRCENCHGNIDEAAREGRATAPLMRGGTEPTCAPASGDPDTFWNCNGDTLRGLHRDETGIVRLRLLNGSGDLEVPQVHEILQAGTNEEMIRGMGRDASGFSHTEVIECHGCHTGFRQYCFGCHVEMDYSQTRTDLLTGRETIGAEITSRFDLDLDLYMIGLNHRGKIASFCPSMQVFLSARDTDGETLLFENRTRTTASGRTGFNFTVDYPHTTSREPQPCVRCHANEADGCSTDFALETYGFGTGRHMLTDEAGTTFDLTQLLDMDGNSLYDFAHEGQGPVPMDMMQRALDTCVF